MDAWVDARNDTNKQKEIQKLDGLDRIFSKRILTMQTSITMKKMAIL